MRPGAILFAACVAFLVGAGAHAAPLDGTVINKIADEGFNHGHVMETAQYLTDRIGGRMTNSPGMRAAEAWTKSEFARFGLTDARAEGFTFGRGWWIESSRVRMIAPRPLDVRAIPIAWTPATDGAVAAEVVLAPLRTVKDFAGFKGKLKGRIVLVSPPTPPRDETQAPFQRMSEGEIDKLRPYHLPAYDPAANARSLERPRFRAALDAFLAEEGALAWAQMSRSDGRLVHGEGSGYRLGATPKVPGLEIAAEDYRRLARLSLVGPVRLEIDSRVHFDDTDPKAYNILADIKGRDPRAGYVMAGAHLDSWVAGDGATDNAAGSAVVMEAARILAALHVAPKRGIRFALWAGEEEGLLGSFAYVDAHLAKRPPADPALAELGPYYASDAYPVQPLPEFKEMNGYFNMDNGSGKLRGVYAEGNFAAAPVLRSWLEPLAGLGAGAVVSERTGSTDHVFMVKLGLPAFQFIQDPLDYESRTHHTDLDTYDHLRADDLRQAAVVLAVVLLSAAESDAPLPANVLPTQPAVTDRFKVPDPGL